MFKTLPVEVLAADYKARMIPLNEIYSWFVKDRDMSPEIDAKQLLKIVEEVMPTLLARNIAGSFLPKDQLTHKIKYTDGHELLVKVLEKTDKRIKHITEYGSSGSDPLFLIESCEPIEGKCHVQKTTNP